ncbi:hypothetical protein PVL29_001338 [Vitis rotundifolia]|uniref:EF-hand domain-containing protein n=1 Tax=Vitis rotundifolia TaxID=103349 RepID=A0AA39AMW6_VITRO|nr:hypothetical protein PVL29_001338 [Vitis rotundifolia]
MVLGLFLGNALVDMYAQSAKCEPPLELLQLYLLELCPMLESIQKCLQPRLCKLDQLTLYELRYQLIAFGKILKDDTTLDAADTDNSGTIEYGEFLAAIDRLNKLMKEFFCDEILI